MLDKARQRPETLYGVVAGADRARQDSGARGRRRVPERHAGPDRRRREDALHLPRRRRRTTPTSSRCPTSSRTARDRWMRSASPRGWSRSTRDVPTTASGVRPARQSREPVLHGILEGERPAGRRPRHDRPVTDAESSGRRGSSRTFRRGRRRCRRPSTSRASTGRPSAITPTGTATRARRRARWPRARRRPATRAWSTCASTNRSTRSSTICRRRPYPFGSVDLARAREGKALFKEKCATCHTPRNQTIYPAATLGVDPNRTMVNTSVSRYGLAALVIEACRIYGLNHQGQPGADWCVPQGRLAGAARRVLPRHAPTRRRGHQRLQGRHAARHLGAGAVPAQRVGAHARPARVPGDAPARGSCAATCTTTKPSSASNGPTGRRPGTRPTRRS